MPATRLPITVNAPQARRRGIVRCWISSTPYPGIAARLRDGTSDALSGSGVAALSGTTVPTSYEDLAAWLGIEGRAAEAGARQLRGRRRSISKARRLRATLDAMMAAAFAAPVPPSALHVAIARASPALVVDTWYDAALRTAFAGSEGWGEIHAASRAKPGEYALVSRL